MIKHLLWFSLLSFLMTCSVTLYAQNSITTQAISVNSVCPGLPLYINFTVKGTYAANNVFTVQLSNGGDYVNLSSSSLNLDSKSGIYTIAALIPASTAAGTTYSLRVIASAPAVIGTPSPTTLTIKTKPSPPLLPAEVVECAKADGSNNVTLFISATATSSSATLKLYNADGTDAYVQSPNINGFVVARVGANYFATQQIDGCESDKREVKVTIKPKANVSAIPLNIYGNGGQDGPYGKIGYCVGDKAQSIKDYGIQPLPDNITVTYKKESGDLEFDGNPPTPRTDKPGQAVYSFNTYLDGCPSSLYPYGRLTITVNARPNKPLVSTTTLSLCQYQSPTSLSASVSTSGATLVWYGKDATSGTGSATPTQPSTNDVGTFKYYVAQRLNDCESDRAEIIVDVKAASPAPTTQNVSYCVGYTAGPLSASATSGGTLKWYATASSTTPLSSAPTPPTTVPATLTYYVTQTVGSACESQRISINVYVSAAPAPPTVAKATYTFCQNSSGETLQAIGQNLKWYDTQTSTTNLGTITPSTTTPGTRQYYVSQTVNTCESARTPITVTVLEAPAAPTVNQTSYTFCQNTPSALITGNINSSASTSWYIYGDEPGLLSFYTVGSTAYAMISTSQARTLTYSVFQTGSNGCKGSASPLITITVNPSPAAPVVQAVSVCQSAPAPVLPSGLIYYTSSTGGTGSTTTPVISTSQAFQTTYFVSQSLNGCESQRSTLSVTVSPIPGVPTVAATGPTYCQNTPASPLSAIGQGTLNWYKESSGGTSLGINPTPDTKDPGSVTYYVSQSVNGCEGARSSIAVKVNATPAVPTLVNTTTSLCQFDAKPTINVRSKAGYTLVVNAKSILAGGGILKDTLIQLTATKDTVLIPSSLVSTADAATFVYRIKNQDGNACVSDQLSFSVVVNATPSAPSVQALAVCQGAGAPTLMANGSNPRWYSTQTGGTGSATPPPVSTAQPGTTNYYVSQTAGVCEGPRATLTVTIKSLPAAPSVSSPLTVCLNSKANQLTATGERLFWYYPDNTPIGSTAPVPFTDQVRTLDYKVTQTVNDCEGPKAVLSVNIVTTPAPTVAQSVVELCQNSSSQALQASGQRLKWTDPSGVVSTTAPSPPTLNATVKPDGDIYYVTQTGDNGCESDRVAIRVFVQTVPTLSITGTTTTNLGLEVPLKLTFTGVGPYRFKLSTGLTGTAVKDTTILFLADKTTTFQVAEVTNKCGSGLPGSGAVATITVRVPTIRTLAFATTTVCAGAGLTTNFTTTGEFNAGSIFKLQIAKADVDTTKAVFTDVPGSLFATGQYASSVPTTLASGTYWVRVVATNPKIPVLGSISPTVLTIKSLASATLTGTQSIYEGQPAKLAVAFTGDGPWSFMYKDSTATTASVTHNVQASTNPYTLEVRPSKTTAYFLTSVGNACGDNAKTSAIVVVSVSPLLGVDDLILSTALQVYPVPATSTLTVRITGLPATQLARFELIDASGKLLSQQESRHETSVLNLDHQPSGTYLLRVRVGERTATKRVVKM